MQKATGHTLLCLHTQGRLTLCLLKCLAVITWQNSKVIIYISFLFFLFFFGLTTTRCSVGKYHMTLSQYHNGVAIHHRWSCHKSRSQGVT